MQDEIFAKQNAINELMKKYGVEAWKFFEEDKGLEFPVSADAHFLLITGKLDLTGLRNLEKDIDLLFHGKDYFFKFYTPMELNSLSGISADMKVSIMNNPVPRTVTERNLPHELPQKEEKEEQITPTNI